MKKIAVQKDYLENLNLNLNKFNDVYDYTGNYNNAYQFGNSEDVRYTNPSIIEFIVWEGEDSLYIPLKMELKKIFKQEIIDKLSNDDLISVYSGLLSLCGDDDCAKIFSNLSVNTREEAIEKVKELQKAKNNLDTLLKKLGEEDVEKAQTRINNLQESEESFDILLRELGKENKEKAVAEINRLKKLEKEKTQSKKEFVIKMTIGVLIGIFLALLIGIFNKPGHDITNTVKLDSLKQENHSIAKELEVYKDSIKVLVACQDSIEELKETINNLPCYNPIGDKSRGEYENLRKMINASINNLSSDRKKEIVKDHLFDKNSKLNIYLNGIILKNTTIETLINFDEVTKFSYVYVTDEYIIYFDSNGEFIKKVENKNKLKKGIYIYDELWVKN